MEVSRKGEEMSRLIDADALIDRFFTWDAICKTYANIDIKGVIDEQPEAVVRCKDCKYQSKGSNEADAWNLCSFRPWLHITIDDYCFCNFGERRTDETN